METIAFFDARPYDRTWFDRLNSAYRIRYLEKAFSPETAQEADGCRAMVAFVNDRLDETSLKAAHAVGIRLICMRCAGYNHVDLAAAERLGLTVTTAAGYSPHAVAEHAMALTLALNRRLHVSFRRTRVFDFTLNGLTGFDLYGKTAGIVGTGRIGRAYERICRGFDMRTLAYDPFPAEDSGLSYVSLDELLFESDVVSLHCPLTPESRHMIGERELKRMKRSALLINTSRGALIDSRALLNALRQGEIRGAALDVYEKEHGVFYHDTSDSSDRDEHLSLLVTLPNAIVTAHQGFLTDEALSEIAASVLTTLDQFFSGRTPASAVTKQLQLV